jgi:hypothetical protein
MCDTPLMMLHADVAILAHSGASTTKTTKGLGRHLSAGHTSARTRSRVLEQIQVRLNALSFVMRGLDPRIHADWPQIESAAWIAGSSPAMTSAKVRFNSIEICLMPTGEIFDSSCSASTPARP